jgi:hypothetical protein
MSRSHTASTDRLIPPLRSLDAPRSIKPSSGSGTGALEKRKRGVNGDGGIRHGADRHTSGCAAGYGPPRVAAVAKAHVHLRAAAQHSQSRSNVKYKTWGEEVLSTSAHRRAEPGHRQTLELSISNKAGLSLWSKQKEKKEAKPNLRPLEDSAKQKNVEPRRWGCRGCRRSASPSPTWSWPPSPPLLLVISKKKALKRALSVVAMLLPRQSPLDSGTAAAGRGICRRRGSGGEGWVGPLGGDRCSSGPWVGLGFAWRRGRSALGFHEGCGSIFHFSCSVGQGPCALCWFRSKSRNFIYCKFVMSRCRR